MNLPLLRSAYVHNFCRRRIGFLLMNARHFLFVCRQPVIALRPFYHISQPDLKRFLALIQNMTEKTDTFMQILQESARRNFTIPSAQLSICRPRKPAAVAARRTSASVNFALGSLLMMITAPMASPSQIIGATT